MSTREVKRPRRYVARHWLLLLRPFMRYSGPRDAYVLRLVGRSRGPVLRPERRQQKRFEGVERRRTRVAA
jgi:hypothetical protein